jgi:hypothetical protein
VCAALLPRVDGAKESRVSSVAVATGGFSWSLEQCRSEAAGELLVEWTGRL